MKIHGRRNISILTNAPTGTCSIAAQTSSGIEPVFRLSYTRRKKINPSDTSARVDFTDDLGDKWQEYTVYHHKFSEWLASPAGGGWAKEESSNEELIAESPYAGATANEIDWVNN